MGECQGSGQLRDVWERNSGLGSSEAVAALVGPGWTSGVTSYPRTGRRSGIAALSVVPGGTVSDVGLNGSVNVPAVRMTQAKPPVTAGTNTKRRPILSWASGGMRKGRTEDVVDLN
jgi:hypothetical protein